MRTAAVFLSLALKRFASKANIRISCFLIIFDTGATVTARFIFARGVDTRVGGFALVDVLTAAPLQPKTLVANTFESFRKSDHGITQLLPIKVDFKMRFFYFGLDQMIPKIPK